MAKGIDLRTYVLLERAFVRRLQRTWQQQSAPIYAKISQACLDHKWDEARRLVSDLDMTEVGTQNREWIQYMLLSCAVFGANIIAKKTPSFVGVGSFDTFLKQTTNNMLQYLEYGGTSQVQDDALQLIAKDEAQTKALIQKQEHQYGNTQIQIDPWSAAAASLNAARDAIRDDDLMGTGKDVDPNHVTVRFGLVHDEDVESLRTFITQQSPFEARVSGIELFSASEHSEGAVPVVARIASVELRALEEEIGKYADFKEKSFPEYKPHCTLAYCKPDAALKYADLSVGGTFLVSGITISHASGVKETIPFGVITKFDPAQPRDARGRWSVTTTPAFKAWFGESKVVDDQGHPLVVYKGMYPYDYTQEGKPGKDWRRGPLIESIHRQTPLPDFPVVEGASPVHIAGFFSDKSNVAEHFLFKAGAIFPVYLSIQHPFEIDAKGEFAGAFQFGEGGKAFREAIRSGKYDGVIIRNTKDEGTIYVALKPEQIKSAISNRTFDPHDPRITKWEEAQHPRDKDGQFTESGVSRFTMAEEEAMSPLEGGGPERSKWLALNQKLIDADEALFAARDARNALRERDKKTFERLGETDSAAAVEFGATLYKTPEFLAAQKRVQDARLAVTAAEIALHAQAPAMKIEVVRNLANDVAKELGVHPWHVNVVDKIPPEFKVGDQVFTEGGHYSPGDEQIEINVHELSYGNAAAVKGIVAHEMSHFVYHTIKAIADQEFQKYLAKALTPDGNDHTAWYHERFEDAPPNSLGKKVRPAFREEIAKEFPASTVMAALSGGDIFAGLSREMINENGHSAYAKSYWAPQAIRDRSGDYEPAINETLAEVTRYLTYPKSWKEDHVPNPDSPWVMLTKRMHQWYRERQARIQAAMAASQAKKTT